MGLSINTMGLEKKLILKQEAFYRKNFSGIPEEVLHGDGFTIELSSNEVVLIDMYNADLLLSKLADEVLTAKAS